MSYLITMKIVPPFRFCKIVQNKVQCRAEFRRLMREWHLVLPNAVNLKYQVAKGSNGNLRENSFLIGQLVPYEGAWLEIWSNLSQWDKGQHGKSKKLGEDYANDPVVSLQMWVCLCFRAW